MGWDFQIVQLSHKTDVPLKAGSYYIKAAGLDSKWTFKIQQEQ